MICLTLLAPDTQAAAEKIRAWGRSMLSEEKITDVINSACQTLGQPCLEAKRRYLQVLAKQPFTAKTSPTNVRNGNQK